MVISAQKESETVIKAVSASFVRCHFTAGASHFRCFLSSGVLISLEDRLAEVLFLGGCGGGEGVLKRFIEEMSVKQRAWNGDGAWCC